MQEARGIIFAGAEAILALAKTTEAHKGVSLNSAHTLPGSRDERRCLLLKRDYG